MPLIGTLTSGVSALRSFTKGLEVIGNNIANVNTTAYKSNQASFADSFSNTLRGSAPSSATGSNQTATQVGTGVALRGISTNFTQGSVSSSGSTTDLAISGNGYFIVKNPTDGSVYATRAGEFRWDDQGFLVNQEGYRVQGLTGGAGSTSPSVIGDIKLRSQAEISASWATDHATEIAAANLAYDSAQSAADELASISSFGVTAADSSLVLTELNARITAADADVVTAAAAGSAALAIAQAKRDALVSARAAVQTAQLEIKTSAAYVAADAAGKQALLLTGVRTSLSSSSVTAQGGAATAAKAALAAATPSQRSSSSIDESGNVVEFYANGTTATSNQLLLKNFNDQNALMKEGNNLYSGFEAAGAINGTGLTGNDRPNQGGLGKIQSGALELSNVDLTEEFANMITAQRSFQASSRLVTVSDTVLEDIVNLKR
ncbi:MAG: Flagellar hook protein FlgE [Verrucomicrobia bacterium ADurb.Bin122]|nr:MAG: Flagellar hook protein FlgE [Verrucomicrobia bacterium ADurb.Bin122]